MRKLLGGDLGLDEASVHISECDWTLLRIPRPSPAPTRPDSAPEVPECGSSQTASACPLIVRPQPVLWDDLDCCGPPTDQAGTATSARLTQRRSSWMPGNRFHILHSQMRLPCSAHPAPSSGRWFTCCRYPS